MSLLVAGIVLAAACAPTDVPAPTVAPPTGADRYLVDPRLGYGAPPTANVDRRFDTAWNLVLAGDYEQARRRLGELQTRNADYLPAQLAEAAILIRENRLDAAQPIVAQLREQLPNWTAARVYEAELAVRTNQTRRAYELYRDLSNLPDAPTFARERLTELETAVFNELQAAAQTAPTTDSVRLLREALTINPGATTTRITLVQRLVAEKMWDDARRELEPLLSAGEVDRTEVQEALAEIDAGRGRYQEAIVRYERLSRRTRDPRHVTRLDEIKTRWNAANLPPHVQQAMDSTALTRSQLAVLMYWNIASVRFAQNLATPPIAIDIGDVAGREEIIRAIALGVFQVDPVTRRVDPYRQVTASSLSRNLGRLLTLRGATCARGTTPEKALAACGIAEPTTAAPDVPVTGADAVRVLAQVDRVLAQ